jgi:hypothetical protein
MSVDLEMMLKEAVVDYFKILSQYLNPKVSDDGAL